MYYSWHDQNELHDYMAGGTMVYSGSCSQLVIRGVLVQIPFDAYAHRQGIVPTSVSLDPGVVNGYTAGIYSFKCTVRH